MLGVDHQHGRPGEIEPGADPGVFLKANEKIGCAGRMREEVYTLVDRTLRQQVYERLGRPANVWCGATWQR
jgi:hypothetical protein